MKGKPHGKVQLDDLMVLSGSRGVNAPRLQNTHHVVAPAKGKSKLLSEKRELAPRESHTHTHTHTLTHTRSHTKAAHVDPRGSRAGTSPPDIRVLPCQGWPYGSAEV